MMLFYVDKYGRKVKFPCSDLKEFRRTAISLLERSFIEEIGDVFMENQCGETIKLDYYNWYY